MRSFGRLEWNADYKRTRTLPVAEQIESEPVVCEAGRIPTELVIVRSGFGRLSQHYAASHRTQHILARVISLAWRNCLTTAYDRPTLPLLSLQNTLRAVGFLDALFIPAETFAADILPHVRRTELPEKQQAYCCNLQNSEQKKEQIDGRTLENRTQSHPQTVI